jgi:hypothetical protein
MLLWVLLKFLLVTVALFGGLLIFFRRKTEQLSSQCFILLIINKLEFFIK